jgi:arsenite/tail-anchored protein-transporting ATPase
MTRAILFTGKSGAGVSTIASATALRCAEQGDRTVLLHFGIDLAPDDGEARRAWLPAISAPRLTVMHAGELEPDGWDWSPVEQWLQRFLLERGTATIPFQLDDLPGAGRLRELLSLASLLESAAHDCIVVDCAPALEMLDLLRLMEGIHVWQRQQPQPGHTLVRLARPLVARLASVPDPDAALTALSELSRRLARLHVLLSDGSRTSFRLVAGGRAADVGVLRHTYRALRLLEYPVDAIVLNRPGCDGHSTAPDRGLLADDAGAPPLLEATHEDPDSLDAAALGRIADALYRDSDAGAVLAASPRTTLVTDSTGVALRIPAPITSQEGVRVTQAGDYVTVRLGSAQRVIPLPLALAGRVCTGARLSEGVLSLSFL